MPLLTARESSHYYLPTTGEPFYEVPNKSKGGMRPATIADARKVGAVPSVTTILSILRRPKLESWKVEQAVLSALTLPMLRDEDPDQYAKRVIQDMEAQSQKAREVGTQVHDACAQYAQLHIIGGKDYTIPEISDSAYDLCKPFRTWFDASVTKVHAVEEVFVGDGYAGRCDLVADVQSVGLSIIDLKTQAVKAGNPASYYLDWCLQLSAYRKAWPKTNFTDARKASLLSIVIDTNPGSPTLGGVHTHVWPEGTFDDDVYYETFQAAFRLWRFMNSW